MSTNFHSQWRRGTSAERGGFATAGLGTPFFWYETDTGRIYYWDGAWSVVPSSAGGVANQVAYWSASDVLDGDSNFTWDGTNLDLLDGRYIRLGTGHDGQIYVSADDLYIDNVTSNQDIYVRVNDGGVQTTILFFDGSENRLYLKGTSLYSGVSTGIGFLTNDDDIGIQQDGANAIFRGYAYGTGMFTSLAGRAARGTGASPTASQADDELLRMGGAGYGATGFAPGNRAMIKFVANENWTDAAQGTYISFLVTHNTTSGPLEAMRVDHNRRVGIRVTNPLAQLDVDQGSATAGIPVLKLDQGDEDVVLVKIVGTAAAASADRTLVADSDFGTPGALVGWIQVEIQDDGNRVADGDYYIPFYAVPT